MAVDTAVSATEVSPEVFDHVAAQHCAGWEERSLNAVRSLLVDRKRLKDVAKEFGMTPQHANTIRRRFLNYVAKAAIVKVPAEEFMAQEPPANAKVISPLELFRSELRRLLTCGYSDEQIGDYLRANDVQVSADELSIFLGAMKK